MTDVVLERLDAFATYLEAASKTPAFTKVRSLQCEALLRVFDKCPLTMDRASRITAKLSSMMWTSEQLGELSEKVASQISIEVASAADAGTLAGRSALQDFSHVAGYLTNKMWTFLSSTTVSHASKIETFLVHVCNLGCAYPTESSSQMFAAVLLMVTEGEGVNKLPPAVMLATVKSIKKEHKKLVKAGRVAATRPSNLPAAAEELQAKFPQLWKACFGEDHPIPCPIDLSILRNLSSGIPMRASRASASAPLISIGTNFEAQATSMAQGMMQQMQQMQRFQEYTMQFMQSGSFPAFGQLGGSSSSSGFETPPRPQRLQMLEGTLASVSRGPLQLQPALRQAPAVVPELEAPAVPDPPPLGHEHVKPIVEHADEDEQKPPSTKRKSVDEATKLMLESMAANKALSREQAEDRAAAKIQSPKAKSPKAKVKAKAKTKAKPAVPTVKTPAVAKPTKGWEHTRSQILCRTGLKGAGQSKAFKFKAGDAASMKKATLQADRWIAAERKKLA